MKIYRNGLRKVTPTLVVGCLLVGYYSRIDFLRPAYLDIQ